MSWDYLSEEEAEELLQATYQNPMIVTVKCPSVQGGMLENAKFRVSKRTSEMYLRSKEWEENIYNNPICAMNIYIDDVLVNPDYILDFKKGGNAFEEEFCLGGTPINTLK